MLEARSAISGATGRNGGHIKAVPWADYYALKEAFGKDSAMRITKFRLAHLDALVQEAAALGEAGKVGLVRRVEGVSAVFDQETWAFAKRKLEAWLEDFPEEREKWTVHERESELKVPFPTNPEGLCLIFCRNLGSSTPTDVSRALQEQHGPTGFLVAFYRIYWRQDKCLLKRIHLQKKSVEVNLRVIPTKCRLQEAPYQRCTSFTARMPTRPIYYHS